MPFGRNHINNDTYMYVMYNCMYLNDIIRIYPERELSSLLLVLFIYREQKFRHSINIGIIVIAIAIHVHREAKRYDSSLKAVTTFGQYIIYSSATKWLSSPLHVALSASLSLAVH